MRRQLLAATALVVSSCATLSPRVPRFVTVYEQRTGTCLIQVVRDTRTSACFVGFRCGRQPFTVVNAAPEVCVP